MKPLTKELLLRVVAVLLSAGCLFAADGRDKNKSFGPDRMDTVLYGVAYYPEYMPYDRLDKDIALMRSAGINVVRVGESTWSSWEPRDGDFQFAWMERVLNRMQEAGIKVILGTPTYSIPTWLYRKCPEIATTHLGASPPLSDPYDPSYPGIEKGGAYGPRQNIDLTNPVYRKYAERVTRAVVEHFGKHPAVIGYQVDNETTWSSSIAPTRYSQALFVERLRKKFGTTEALNREWGLAYWGQLVNSWDDVPSRDGILNPGYKLEWENFQHDVITEFIGSQARIVSEYRRPGQFITTCYPGGIRAELDQWGLASVIDVVAKNIYFKTQDQLDARSIWFSADVARSLKHTNFLVTETNAQSIGWDSRTQFPLYPGQVRLVAYAELAAGANMVEYWHWHSLHYGQETFWRGVLGHDLEPGRTYAEVAKVGGELKRLGPQLANLNKAGRNKVAILYSNDSLHAINYMPFSDKIDYMTVLTQMYEALYALNIEPDFVQPGDPSISDYKVLLVPPLYSASDRVLQQLSEYVNHGGTVVIAFKSGFANECSTVRWVAAPGPLRDAAGFHYQEFSTLAEPLKLVPDPYQVADKNTASTWAEFLVPDTAEVISSYDHPVWKFPALTRNKFGNGMLVYEGTVISNELQRQIIWDALRRAGLTGPDQTLPAAIKVRHGRNASGRLLHYYLNFSANKQAFAYPYANGTDLLTDKAIATGESLQVGPWDLAIIAEQ